MITQRAIPDLTRRTEGICNFLVPYFEIKDPSKIEIAILPEDIMGMPRAESGEKDQNKFRIYLLEDKEKDYVIAHELGHCLHWLASGPESYPYPYAQMQLFGETVAEYAELIQHLQADPFPTGPIRLPDLLKVRPNKDADWRNPSDLGRLYDGIDREQLSQLNNSINEIRIKEGLIPDWRKTKEGLIS